MSPQQRWIAAGRGWALAAGAALAWAVLRLTAAAAAEPAPGFVTYNYTEIDEGQEKAVRLAIPNGLTTIRGLFVNTNAAGGDTRTRYTLGYLKAFAALHDLAFVGAKAFNSHPGSVAVLQHALDRWATETGHPELARVPFVIYGFSAGGGFANRLVNTLPERCVASAPLSTAMRMEVPDEALQVPVCMFSGELEGRLNPLLTETMQTHRPRGAPFAWAMLEGRAHQELDQATLALPFLDHCLRLRYPAEAEPQGGPVALKRLPLASGWLADNTTWRSALVKISPCDDAGARSATTSWLPDEDVAWLYRAYATFGPPLKLTNPPSGATWVLKAGANLTITVDDTAFAGWRQMALYEGAQKLAEIAPGPAQFALSDLRPGVHAYYVMATDPQGLSRASHPALVVVAPAAP